MTVSFYVIGNFVPYDIKPSGRMRTSAKGNVSLKRPRLAREFRKRNSLFYGRGAWHPRFLNIAFLGRSYGAMYENERKYNV